MTDKVIYTGEQCKLSMVTHNIHQVPHHDCGGCGEWVSYVRVNNSLFFDSNCDCTCYRTQPEERSWDDLADFINRCSGPAHSRLVKAVGLDRPIPQALMEYTLFLDNERWPAKGLKGEVVICRTSTAFQKTIEALGFPEAIYFDNNLGEASAMEGRQCAKWLLDRCRDLFESRQQVPDIRFHVHSLNPIAAKEIEAIGRDIANLHSRCQSSTEVKHHE